MPEAPRLYPCLQCRDADAMMRWLCDVLGFRERVAYRDRQGIIHHAELALGSSILMLGQARDDEDGRRVGPSEARRTDGLYLAVDDADALHAKVKAAGGEIVRPLTTTDYGSRDFSCRDPEGNLWNVGTYWPKADEAPLPG